MFNDNKLKEVANAVSKIMEASMKEELKGNQHKIDANKNNKIDAHDFKLLRSGKKVAKEEVESVEEGIEDRIAAAKVMAAASGKSVKSPAAEKSRTTKVAGKAYGGAAQKDDAEDDDDDTMKKKTKGSFKRRYNTKMYKEQFSGLLDSYIEGGLKSLMENLEVVEVEEEVDNATFTKEVEAQKEKNAGRGKKADVAAAAVQSVRNEEVEQIDESTLTEQEMKKRGDVVKGTKKNLAGFKERSGNTMRTWEIEVEDGPHQYFQVTQTAATLQDAIRMVRERLKKQHPGVNFLISPHDLHREIK